VISALKLFRTAAIYIKWEWSEFFEHVCTRTYTKSWIIFWDRNLAKYKQVLRQHKRVT